MGDLSEHNSEQQIDQRLTFLDEFFSHIIDGIFGHEASTLMWKSILSAQKHPLKKWIKYSKADQKYEFSYYPISAEKRADVAKFIEDIFKDKLPFDIYLKYKPNAKFENSLLSEECLPSNQTIKVFSSSFFDRVDAEICNEHPMIRIYSLHQDNETKEEKNGYPHEKSLFCDHEPAILGKDFVLSASSKSPELISNPGIESIKREEENEKKADLKLYKKKFAKIKFIEKERKILDLKLDGKSYSEICKHTGLKSKNSVFKYIRNATKKIQQKFPGFDSERFLRDLGIFRKASVPRIIGGNDYVMEEKTAARPNFKRIESPAPADKESGGES